MATDNSLPAGPATTQNPGPTPEHITQIAELEATRQELLTVSKAINNKIKAEVLANDPDAHFTVVNRAIDDNSEAKAAQTAFFKSTRDLNDYKTVVRSEVRELTTYHDATGAEITIDQYHQMERYDAEIGITFAGTKNITGSDGTGVVTNADPVAKVADKDEVPTLDGLTPGTPEYEDAEEEIELYERRQESQKLFEESAARDEARKNTIAGDAAYNQALKDATDAKTQVDRENDWRVRLHLGPGAKYLYAADDPGILAPLAETKGIIFPYTPEIAVQYTAGYENYDLTHSNYRGYFYTGSKVENIILTATFTANNLEEANYMLATMHFLRSATKMFYGQDKERGMPPPILFLTGLGEYQFDNHPCALTMFQYNLPTDVDYIPCGKPTGIPQPPIPKREEFSTPESRLRGGECGIGGDYSHDGPNNAAIAERMVSPYQKATYVPTQISLNFTMIPIQTRDQVSKEFSLKEYATGGLLKKGFW